MNNNVPAVIEAEIVPVVEEEDEHDKDLAYARANLYDAIETAKQGVKEMSDVANCSQNARAYEVHHQYLKTLSELNKDLIQISKDKKFAKGPRDHPSKIQNNLFVGSTAELSKMLKALKKNDAT